jgi:hypothetical protein
LITSRLHARTGEGGTARSTVANEAGYNHQIRYIT